MGQRLWQADEIPDGLFVGINQSFASHRVIPFT